MTTIPADVAHVLQRASRCPGCDRIHPWGKGKHCNDCIRLKAIGAKPQPVKRPALKLRGLGEY